MNAQAAGSLDQVVQAKGVQAQINTCVLTIVCC